MRMQQFLYLPLTLDTMIALTLVLADEIYNLLASKFFSWPNAMDFYRSMGWKYLGDVTTP